ncbi:ABC transporter ATP-binding protein [Microvirga arabica]|uniref:ABC transporter ATP-binding protein n=1 Tax=Microvirga arabica TaxID=1128671 RepID=A0ABV6YBV5_9HYPH
MSTEAVIDVRDLQKWYSLNQGFLSSILGREERHLKAVDGVSFALGRGEVLGLAGESGCGKSTTGMTVLQLHQPTGGEIVFEGRNMASVRDSASMKEFRRKAQIVFQNPYESLNPRFTVEQSVQEPVTIHFAGDPTERVIVAMERAGLVPVENFLSRYPHQLSGGQLQRIAIARAISVEPRFLVADEPVSMLDVSIRAGILNLFKRFADELGMSILYISHDLSTMRHVCTRVAIMYLGRIVEVGPADEILDRPQHPYAQALMAAAPVMGARNRKRVQLQGAVPNPIDVPGGCSFHPRCPKAISACNKVAPEFRAIGARRSVACHLYA